LNKVGIYLNKEVYRHGKLYVALSRATNKEGLKLLVDDNECPSRTA
jgi:ATP-dependent DNA helicase PIF1